MSTRYIKVIRDLTSDYAKTFMLVLAISIGVFGIGSILGAYSVIKREMADNYTGTSPASATIELKDSISSSILEEIKVLPGIKIAERHATVSARMKIGDQWRTLLLFVIDDFAEKQTNRFAHLSGRKVPPKGFMLVERSALVVMKAKEGDEILIKTPHGKVKKVKLGGVVHDPSLAPAWQEEGGYGYITLSTLQWLGENQGFDQLRLLVSENQHSRDYIKKIVTTVAKKLEGSGLPIREIQIPPPGRHPHQSQMDAVMSIFIIFSFLTLILGSILVSTSIATLMVRHIRQIGIMKTVGASSWQISKLYLLMTLSICLVALLVAIPLSQWAASGFYRQITELLNLEIRNSAIPLWVPLIQIASGLIIPLMVVAIPVVRGSRISVRIALDNYGVSQKHQAAGVWIMKLSKIAIFGETFLLSVRNVFRQRSRLIITLGLLAAGGAMFMTALNVSEAWNDNLSRIYTQRLYDLEVKFNTPLPENTALLAVKNLSGVVRAEGWCQYSTSLVQEDSFSITHTYPDKGHGSFSIQAVPLATRLLSPTIVKGRWLNTVANEVVLNQLARRLIPGVDTGDTISLLLNGRPTQWKVVGFTEDVGTPATAYVPLEFFNKLRDSQDINVFRIAYSDRTRENTVEKNIEVEKAFERENIKIRSATPVWLLHNAIASHMKVLINSLLAMAIMMGIVGTLGLMSTMSMNVMERTREIGVMRTIGATPGKIRNLVTGEGLIIGLISIFIAFILSLFLSYYLGRFIGNMAFGIPLSLVLSITGLLIWILIIGIGSYIATYYPARKANVITIREALAYE